MQKADVSGEAAPQLVILHVDDDPMNLRVVSEILTAFGFTGVQAGSGEEALDQLIGRRFDVVLMDIHMPRMSGIEVVRRLRASLGPERGTPVIALTADVLTRTRTEYLALGFDDFVTKPILVSRLLEGIHRVVAADRGVQVRKIA
jgi:CheY-like chemotaxis protein